MEATPPAGEHQHVQLVGVHLLQGQVGLDGDAVAARDHAPVHAHQGGDDPGPAQQVGGHQGLGLLKPLAQ